MRDYINRTIVAYDRSAGDRVRQYESISFYEIHSEWISFLPSHGGSILDVGSGSGRDAAALTSLGYSVTAVEPSGQLLKYARKLHRDVRIRWIQDSLPELTALDETSFDFILLSGVIGHLNKTDRKRSIMRLSGLMKHGSRIVVSIRSVPLIPDGRVYFDVDCSEVEEVATHAGLRLLTEFREPDKMGREGILWTVLVFERI